MIYSIIGTSLLHTNLLIGDPGVNPITENMEGIPDESKRKICVTDLKKGGYYSYHVGQIEAPALAKELLFLHETVSTKEIDGLNKESIGSIYPLSSSTIYLCDEEKAFDAETSYVLIEDNAMYNVGGLLKQVERAGISEWTADSVREVLRGRREDDLIKGAEFYDTFSPLATPDFFRQVASNHWTVEILRRLEHTPAVPIIGGVASNTDYCEIPVYKLVKGTEAVGIIATILTDET